MRARNAVLKSVALNRTATTTGQKLKIGRIDSGVPQMSKERPAHGRGCECFSRRRALQLFAGAAGAGLLLPSATFASGSAAALVLTCMDYRLVDDGVNYFNERGLKNKYDHVVLAGASIGALGKLGQEWADTFWKHVGTAIKLHGIHEVIVVDHRDCGAFKIVFGKESIAQRADETALHKQQAALLTAQIKQKFPELKTEMLLMDLDGSVEVLSGGGHKIESKKRPGAVHASDSGSSEGSNSRLDSLLPGGSP
jgi:hypothetical protein